MMNLLSTSCTGPGQFILNWDIINALSYMNRQHVMTGGIKVMTACKNRLGLETAKPEVRIHHASRAHVKRPTLSGGCWD